VSSDRSGVSDRNAIPIRQLIRCCGRANRTMNPLCQYCWPGNVRDCRGWSSDLFSPRQAQSWMCLGPALVHRKLNHSRPSKMAPGWQPRLRGPRSANEEAEGRSEPRVGTRRNGHRHFRQFRRIDCSGFINRHNFFRTHPLYHTCIQPPFWHRPCPNQSEKKGAMLMRDAPESLVFELFSLGRAEGGHEQQENERRKYKKTARSGCSCSLHVGPVVRSGCCRPFSQSRRQGDLQSREGDWQGRKSCREVPFLT
jgi:hypothetical protein